MSVEIRIPEAGDSVTEVYIGQWYVQEGDFVEKDQPVVEIETDKASMELNAPEAGKITKLLKAEGDVAEVDEVVVTIDETATGGASNNGKSGSAEEKSEEKPKAEEKKEEKPEKADSGSGQEKVMPAAAREAHDKGVDVASVKGTGPGGRTLKEDVQRAANAGTDPEVQASAPMGNREESVKRVSRLRSKIAERLVNAQQTAALLTTFNEIDMSEVMATRSQYKELFTKKYGIKLGFMSFFVKAVCDALKQYPQINAEFLGDSIRYYNYMDVGIAVGGGKGLVVPVLRNAEQMSFAEVELQIADFGKRAQANELTPDEMTGGTFTITNGGVYGSLLSTPIVNPPQSGILGLHGIKERPVAIDGEVVIRPMMYVALTYDHRIVDGREAVGFLVRVKETIEDPARMLMEV